MNKKIFKLQPIGKEFVFEFEDLNLKEVRKMQGHTLRQVEDSTGISNAYLSQLETGKVKKPSFEIVNKLLTYYGFKVNITKQR